VVCLAGDVHAAEHLKPLTLARHRT
jgi:hypothetical protein